MKKVLLLLVCTYGILNNVPAQTARIEYTTILKLNPGEEVNNLLSCWIPDGNKMPTQLVIRQSNGSFSTISGGVRKDNLTYNDVATRRCNSEDAYKVPKDSYSNPFRRLLPNGMYNIRSEKKDLGSYDDIFRMRVAGNRFVAVVAEGKGSAAQYFYLDSDGKKVALDGKPTELITNQDLSRSAVVLAGKGTSLEEASKDLTRQVWFPDNNKTLTVQRKSRLSFDISGRHFIEIQPKTFYIDGVAHQRDISGGGTLLFVSPDGADWAYFYQIYMGFSNNTYFQNVFNPFLTTEQGKECLNWFIVQKENTGYVLKLGQRKW